MYHFLNSLTKECGLSVSPYSFMKCDGTPIIGDAVNLMGIGAQADNVDRTNEANLEAVRMNNETQKELAAEANKLSQEQFQTNLGWLKEQYFGNQQREDSRYQRMVKDMQAAGLNPALATGQPSSASAVGAVSPSQFHVAQTEAAHFDPYNLDFDPLASGIARSIGMFYQNRKTDAETKNINLSSQAQSITNMSKMVRDMEEINQIRAQTDKLLNDSDVSKETKSLIRSQRALLDKNYELLQKQFPALAAQPEKSNSVLDAQYEQIMSQTALNKVETALKPALAQMQIRMSNAQINLFNEQSRLVSQQVITEFYNGQLTDRKSFEQTLRNRLLDMEYSDKQTKTQIRDSDALTKTVYWFSDYLSDIIFGNLGKIIK